MKTEHSRNSLPLSLHLERLLLVVLGTMLLLLAKDVNGYCHHEIPIDVSTRMMSNSEDPNSKSPLVKIAVFSDLHFGEGKLPDDASVELMHRLLEAHKPDLVVYDGDQVSQSDLEEHDAPVDGCLVEDTVDKPQHRPTPTDRGVHRCWQQAVSPCVDRQIPFFTVGGNHDLGPYLHDLDALFRGETTEPTWPETNRRDGNEKMKEKKKLSMSCPGSFSVVDFVDARSRSGDVRSHARSAVMLRLFGFNTMKESKFMVVPLVDGNGVVEPHVVKEFDAFLEAEEEKRQGLSSATAHDKMAPVGPPDAVAFLHIPFQTMTNLSNVHGFWSERICCQSNEMLGSVMMEKLLRSERSGVRAVISGHDHQNDFWGIGRKASWQDDEHQDTSSMRYMYTRKTGMGGYMPAMFPPGARMLWLDSSQSDREEGGSSSTQVDERIVWRSSNMILRTAIATEKDAHVVQPQVPEQHLVFLKKQATCCGYRDYRPLALSIILHFVLPLALLSFLAFKLYRHRKGGSRLLRSVFRRHHHHHPQRSGRVDRVV